MGSIIIQFNHTNLELSIIQGPPINQLPVNNYVLMKTKKAKTDMLGCAIMQESGLCLWSTETVPDGSVEWTQGRVIKLDMLLASNSSVIGFVDGIDVFYVGTESGIFTLDLKSGGVKNILPVLRKKANKIRRFRTFSVIPYMSFYTPDQARTTSGQVGNEDGDEWEKVGNGEKKGEQQQEEEAAQDHFNSGSKAFQDGDFFRAVDCLHRSLKISPRNKQTCLIFKSPESGDAKSIPLWKSRIQKLKRANVALLANIADDASGTEVDLEESSPAKDIQFVTNILLSSLEKKLERLEQEISTPVSRGNGRNNRTTGSTGTDLEAAGRGIKRANVEQASSEPSPKKLAEGSSSVKVDSSNNSDGHLSAPDSDGSVSE